MFITEEDYRVVIGENALKVVSQASQEIRDNAELEACEEIAGYLRPKYDTEAVFSAEGENRNRLVVMYTADIALYHMIAAMPQKYGQRNTQGALRACHKVAGRRASRKNHTRPAARHRRGRHTDWRPAHIRFTETITT